MGSTRPTSFHTSYDGEGKRVKKVTATETTIFVYSLGRLVAEYSTQISQTPVTAYLTSDHLGSPRVVTDGLGQVVSRRDFMPFGEELGVGIGERSSGLKYGTGGDAVRKRFAGYQKDEETGLDFAEARMYENRHGRFTAVDPLLASGVSSNPQSFNRYTYVMNSPTVLVDPTGLVSESSNDCNFKCRVIRGIGDGKISDDDLALAKFHVANGTALGSIFTNAAEREITRRQAQPATTESSVDGSGNSLQARVVRQVRPSTRRAAAARARVRNNRRPRRNRPDPVGPGLNESNQLNALENSLREILLVPKAMPAFVQTDGNIFHRHHIFPVQFSQWFGNRGVTIDNYTVGLHKSIHNRGVHNPPGGARWNDVWGNFIQQNPNATRQQIFEQARHMIIQYGISGNLQQYNRPIRYMSAP